jgi:hypothetical protein
MVRSTLRPATLTPDAADRLIQEMYGYSGRDALDKAQAQPLPPYSLEKATRIIDGATPGGVDIAAMVSWWCTKDAERRGKGGRPPHVSLRAILILRLAHALAYRPQTIRHIADTVVMTFTEEEFNALGIEDDDADGSVWYQRLTSANDTLVKTMDPSIYPVYKAGSHELPSIPERLNRHRRLTKIQQSELSEFRRPQFELITELQTRLDDFLFEQNANVIRTVQSAGLLDGFDGAVALDATYVDVHGKATYEDNQRAGSTTSEAGLWGRGGDHSVDAAAGKSKTPKFKFGFETDIVTMTRGDSNRVPELILGINVHAPGRITGVAETIFSRIAQLNLPRGDCSVDRAYNNLVPGNFHEVMIRQGYELVFDYPHDELGQQTSYVSNGTGYIMVDGSWYLALMGDALATCTSDHLSLETSDPLWIDEQTMLDRIQSRQAYQLHRHGLRDHDGYQRYTLPPPSGYIAFDPLTGELLEKPTVSTVTIPMAVGARWGQKYPFRSPEWQNAYNLRSAVERKNRELKHENFIGLESADRRPKRGYAANAIAIAMLVTTANLKTLDNFLRTSEGIDTTKSPRRRKPRRQVELKIAGAMKQADARSSTKQTPKAA